MNSNWKECTIADLGEVVGGATPSTKEKQYYENGSIPWITPKDLSSFSGRYISHGERNITEKGLKSCSAQLLPKHSVLFSSRAPIGYIAIADCPLCTNQGFKSIVPNSETDYLFLYYLLKYNKDKIENMGSGTTFKEVSGSTMKLIKVRVPKETVLQSKIGFLLGNIDDTIETLQETKREIQALLQNIFKDLFASNSQDSILSQICHYTNERIAVSELTTENYYSTENMLPNKGGVTIAEKLPTISQTPRCREGNVLISNIRPYFKKILYCTKESGCSQDVLCFVPIKQKYSAYLYCTLYEDKFFDFMTAGAKGTKMPRGDKQQIMRYAVYDPDEEQIAKFNHIAEPLLKRIETIDLLSKEYENLRDTLLPKLMSGEIDVSNVQI